MHQQHEKLVRALADQHALTVARDHDERVPDEAFDVLMERAQTLMAYEKQIPTLLAEPERARSKKIIFWSWRAQSVAAIALITAFRLLGYPDDWYAPVVPPGGRLLRLATQGDREEPPRPPHRIRRLATVEALLVPAPARGDFARRSARRQGRLLLCSHKVT